MDAKVGDWVVTPRIGKPVEVQALWLHALAGASGIERTADAASPKAAAWLDLAARGRARFAEVFWNESTGCLYDVVDVDHEPGRHDGAIRPNQILAVGGLGEPLLDRDPRPVGRRRRRSDALDAARPALAGAGRARLRAALRGAAAGARRRLPPGHGLAVVPRRRSSKPGCASTVTTPTRWRWRGRGSWRRCAPTSTRPARPRHRDRRRRGAVHAARLSVPGVVGGRARACGPDGRSRAAGHSGTLTPA